MTSFSAAVAGLGLELLARLALLGEHLGELGLVVVEAVQRVVQGAVDLGLHDRLRQRHLDLLEQSVQRGVADLLGLLGALDPATCSGRLARSSSMVSNSLASWANSSSGSGSSRSLIDLTVTVTWASCPACSPAASFAVNSRDSSADRPTSASSRPSMSRPEPTSWDSPSRGRARHLLAVDGGRQVDRDEVTVGHRPVHAGQGAEPGAQGLQFGVDVFVADLDRIHRDLSARPGPEG